MAFNAENAARFKVEEPVGSVDLETEDRNEVEGHLEVDRKHDIVKRLNAISERLPFHSEFLQTLLEKRNIIADEQDGVTVFKFVEKRETTENGDNEQEVEPDSKRKHSRDAENSNDKILQDPTENKISDVFNLENCADDTVTLSDFQGDAKNPKPTPEIDDDDEKLMNVQYRPIYEFNLDTMLYYTVGQFNIAKLRNDDVLRVMPDNFNALWNKVKLMIAIAKESGDCIDETAEEILNQLEQTVSNNGNEMLIAKAEIAAMYTDVPVSGDTLTCCIRLYEKVLEEVNLSNRNESVDHLPEKLVAFWKCYLVKAYAMLTNENKELLANHGYNHGEVLSRLEELVLAVDSSDHIDNNLKAKTWVNMANTFDHFRQNYPTESFRREVFSGLSLADFLANAREYDPGNPRILMRSGRELRQRATSIQELTEAIDLLERALKGDDIDDIRDIIYHHIGLTYKSLWIHTEKPVCEKIIEDAYKSSRNNLLPTTLHISPPFGCRVVKPPDHPLNFELIPAPFKQVPRTAFWKILIPIANDPENPHLLEAIRCFEKAVRSYDEVSYTLYLLDIARAYSNMQNMQKAREYFQKTLNNADSESVRENFVGVSLFENLAHFEECEMIRRAFRDFKSQYLQDTRRNVDRNSEGEGLDDVSLFENLAHFEESEMIRKAFTDLESEKVKSLYRESIRFSPISKTKAIVAFHYILRILYKQLTLSVNNPLPELDQMILQNEYFLLYMAIHEAKINSEIVNSLATDDFRIALMWRLIEMFNRRNQQYDAAAAFTYLSILAIAKKLTAEVKGINFTSIEKQRMLIQTVERVALQRVEQPRFLPEPYRQLHALREDDIAENASDCRNIGLLHTLTDMERKKLDIVMQIIQPGFTCSTGYIRLTEECY